MRVEVKNIDPKEEEHIVIYCHHVTPKIKSLVEKLQSDEKKQLFLAFYKDEQQFYPDLNEILFFETNDEKVFAHSLSDTYETRQRLYELEACLPENFVRISRSTIANTSHVYSIQRGLTRTGTVSFRDTYKVTYVSRLYLHHLMQKMEERYVHE